VVVYEQNNQRMGKLQWYTRQVPAVVVRPIPPMSQVLFGTDYPFEPSIAPTLEGLKTVGFSEAELHAIERDNALALLPRFKAAVAAA